jgi:hypothetical protein
MGYDLVGGSGWERGWRWRWGVDGPACGVRCGMSWVGNGGRSWRHGMAMAVQ